MHGHNTEASSIPGHPVTLHTCPTEHSQDPAAPLTQPTASPGTLWHLSPVPAVSLGTPHCLQLWLPAVPITCCSEAELWALLHCYLSPSASCWHHSSPCTAGARASSWSQAWQGGRRRQFSLALKGDRASSFPCQAGARQELSCTPLAGHKVLPGGIPAPPAAPRTVWI